MAHNDEHRMGDAAGEMLRWLMAYVALCGALLAVYTTTLIPEYGFSWVVAYPVALMVPYLVIRYRDPESTTLPFQRYLASATAR